MTLSLEYGLFDLCICLLSVAFLLPVEMAGNGLLRARPTPIPRRRCDIGILLYLWGLRKWLSLDLHLFIQPTLSSTAPHSTE